MSQKVLDLVSESHKKHGLRIPGLNTSRTSEHPIGWNKWWRHWLTSGRATTQCVRGTITVTGVQAVGVTRKMDRSNHIAAVRQSMHKQRVDVRSFVRPCGGRSNARSASVVRSRPVQPASQSYSAKHFISRSRSRPSARMHISKTTIMTTTTTVIYLPRYCWNYQQTNPPDNPTSNKRSRRSCTATSVMCHTTLTAKRLHARRQALL